MTPKSLLRLPQAASAIADMAEGTRFQPVLAEPGVDDEKVTRLVLCTGKIYYDLVGHPERARTPASRSARVELLYPFPEGQILELMERYPNLREVLWVQEEPRNMGARAHMFPRLMQIMPDEHALRLHRAPGAGEPGRGLPGRAHRRTEPHRHDGDRPAPADLAVPAQDAGRALMWALWRRFLGIRRQNARCARAASAGRRAARRVVV